MPTPIEMPPYISSREFDPSYPQQLSPTGEQGFVQTLNRGSAFWRANYTTGGLSETRWREMTVFKDSLEGAIGTFLAYDPRRPMPYAFMNSPITDDPWTQTGQAAPRLTAFDYANSSITIDHLQNGVQITWGDYISVQVDNVWYLFRIQQNVFGVAGNTVVGLKVKPRPNIINFTLPMNMRYRQACCEMKVIGKFAESDTFDQLPTMQWQAAQYMARAPT